MAENWEVAFMEIKTYMKVQASDIKEIKSDVKFLRDKTTEQNGKLTKQSADILVNAEGVKTNRALIFRIVIWFAMASSLFVGIAKLIVGK